MVVCGVALTVSSDILLKESGGRGVKLLVGTLIYGSTALIVAAAFRRSGFSQLFVLWESLTVVGGLIVGFFLFKEPVTTARALAVVFAVCAIILTL
jgi:multidrug transporter EmrE-like cation transporter